MGIKKGSPIDKKIILVKKYSRRSIGRKIETFCRSLDKNNTGSQDFGHSRRIQNPTSFKTFSVKNLFLTIVSQEGEKLVELEVKEMLKKKAIRKVQPSSSSNLFLVKKKDLSQRPLINLKQLNAYIPYFHFKMESLQNLKNMLQKGDYMCNRLKRCIFLNSLGKKFKAVCSLLLLRKLV